MSLQSKQVKTVNDIRYMKSSGEQNFLKSPDNSSILTWDSAKNLKLVKLFTFLDSLLKYSKRAVVNIVISMSSILIIRKM